VPDPVIPPAVGDAVVETELEAQPGLGLRARAARGTVVNAGFLVAVNALGLLKGVIVAGLLGVGEYGTWGLLVAVYGTLAWLAAIGLDDKYIQQDHPDQEEAFQIAFTLQCALCAAFTLVALAAVPVFALAYDQPSIVAPGLVLAAALPAVALQTPLWVFVRRLEFLRQRRLQIWDPVTSFVVTVALCAAGAGVWGLVAGTLCGAWAAAVVAFRASPYRMVLRRSALEAVREYADFSWPIFLGSATAVVAVQAPLFVASRKLGLEAVGDITLATTVAMFAYRVDEVITQSLYPAIARVKHDVGLLWEAFRMSNRLALLWALPFGAAAVLFAAPLVDHVLGDRWRPAVILIQCLGAAAAINQVGFNWSAFLRARGQTRPIAVADGVFLAAVLAIAVPLLLAHGLRGYGAGWLIAVLPFVAVRLGYLGRLFGLRTMLAALVGAAWPTLPAVIAVLALRAAIGEATAARALVEAALFAAVVLAATVWWERGELREAVRLLRARPPAPATAAPPR
jgi:O-antigen/teichoic acid export membrane protein